MKKIKLNHGEISNLCMELSSLLHAGVTGADGLVLLSEGEEDEQIQKMLNTAALRMDNGDSLSTVLREECGLPVYLCGLLEVGERSGRMEEALVSLSDYYEQKSTMERRMRSALFYPAVMLIFMLLVIGVLLIQVLPMFDEVYAMLGGRLTGVAGGLLVLGQGLKVSLPMLGGILGLAVVLVVVLSVQEEWREQVLQIFRRRLGDHGLLYRRNNARLIQAISMAMRSGLSAEDALSLAAGLVEDLPTAYTRCLACRTLVDEGKTVAEALCESGIFNRAQSRLFAISERSGAGDAAMERIAHTMTEEAEQDLEDAVGKIEPTLVMLCSVLVGMILLSVMLPLMHIMTALG